MDTLMLMPSALDLSPYQFGMPQRSGAMTILPIFGPEAEGGFATPLSGLNLSRVRGYGSVELANRSDGGVAIIPLHMGHIQDGAQNHALCRTSFLAAGQKRTFDDACCVQAAQSGYLEGRDQWFFILPLPLREAALNLRGERNYGKLWGEIARLNAQFGLAGRGHLEQIITRQRAFLTQYQSRFELLPRQTGALFFLRDRPVGLEIAPNAAYFAEVWMPLVCFCYGVAAMYEERHKGAADPPVAPFPARNLSELREALALHRRQLQEQVRSRLAQTPPESFHRKEEERFLDYRLYTVESRIFIGQYVQATTAVEGEANRPVENEAGRPGGGLRAALKRITGREAAAAPAPPPGRLVYASLFARRSYLDERVCRN